MNEDQTPKNDILDEFRTLGENLASTLRSIWDSPERKRLQNDVEEGLAELNNTLNKEVESFRESDTGKRLQSDFDDIKQRVSSGEASERAREELRKALEFINTELSKFSESFNKTESADEERESSSAQED